MSVSDSRQAVSLPLPLRYHLLDPLGMQGVYPSIHVMRYLLTVKVPSGRYDLRGTSSALPQVGTSLKVPHPTEGTSWCYLKNVGATSHFTVVCMVGTSSTEEGTSSTIGTTMHYTVVCEVGTSSCEVRQVHTIPMTIQTFKQSAKCNYNALFAILLHSSA